MFISFKIEEIQQFPEEIKKFLYSYINSEKNDTELENMKVHDDSDSFVKSIYEPSPSYCKYERYLFSDDTFDWYNMLKEEITAGMEEEAQNDFKFTVRNKKAEVLFYDVDIQINQPKTWGIPLIFCSIFAFGNKFPEMKVARNTADIINNLKKVGLLKGNIISSKSIGPMLKSITTLVQMHAYKTLGKFEGKVDAIHWFNFTKQKNEFFFAGDTLKLCIEASKKITEEFFLLTNNEFDKIKDDYK